ncbi:CapA family protein [Pelagibacterium limicola]|uniref:CapA family protein n=1 Tax=Pelagibacterium limicola TaxID=2791022 RepID=UPI0018AF61BA|nr:CapA family protein [Pelagibacterium limicola]
MITLAAVGDVGAKRHDPDGMFAGIADALKTADIRFGQLETVVSDRGAMSPNARLAMRTSLDFAPALSRAGFNVMSFAGNHCLDWGYQGFDDTLSAMSKEHIAICGAGEDLSTARRPAILKANGERVAILAYNSILPEGYAATSNRPGCAPLRAHTVYTPIEPDQPGTRARVMSFCDPGDLAAMKADIEKARNAAEYVVVSMHWGIHMTEAVLADYQREAAHAAIDCGAAAVIGHHAHILKGVEFFRGAPIFYSLGNFAIEQPQVWDPAIVETESFRHLASLNPGFDPTRIYMLPQETRFTGIVRLQMAQGAVSRTEFLPAFIGDDSVPQMVGRTDTKFDDILAYLRRINQAEGIETHIVPEGDAIVLSPCSDRS